MLNLDHKPKLNSNKGIRIIQKSAKDYEERLACDMIWIHLLMVIPEYTSTCKKKLGDGCKSVSEEI